MTFVQYPLSLIFVVSLVVIIGAGEIGRAIAIRTKARSGDSISTLEGAVLGLLALMIGFSFAMGLTRYEARREAILNEANAIGTTALRARLLPSPHNTEVLKLLREYVQLRLDITQRPPSPAELSATILRSNVIQEALWQQAKAVAAKDNAIVPTGLFIQTLNEMIDNQRKASGCGVQPAAEHRVARALRHCHGCECPFRLLQPRRVEAVETANRDHGCVGLRHDPVDPGHRPAR